MVEIGAGIDHLRYGVLGDKHCSVAYIKMGAYSEFFQSWGCGMSGQNEQYAPSELLEITRRLGEELIRRGWVLGLAESCTGGGVASAVTAVPGASRWFESGFVVYANRAKEEHLGVSSAIIKERGAVSESVACAMVAGLIARTGVQLGASITGIAGPDGGSAEKPVGTVWFGFGVGSAEPIAEKQVFAGGRDQVRAQAVQHCLTKLLAIAEQG